MQAERKGGKGKTPAAAGGRLPTALAWLLPALLNAASVLRFGSKNAAFVSSPSRAEPAAAEFCLFIFAFVNGGRWPRRAAGGPAGLGDSSGGPSLCPPRLLGRSQGLSESCLWLMGRVYGVWGMNTNKTGDALESAPLYYWYFFLINSGETAPSR